MLSCNCKSITRSTQEVTVKDKYELIVVGGGFAGTAAAISAARQGVDVLLIEKFNALGGAAVSSLVMPFMCYWTQMPENGERKYLSGNLFLEIVSEMNQITGTKEERIAFDEEILKLVLNRMALKYGVNLLFDTTVTDACVSAGKIMSIQALGKSKSLSLSADHFVDTTGDAELSMLAGCSYQVGREGDGLCQPMTLSFRMDGVDMEKFRKNRSRINHLYQEWKQKGWIKNPHEDVLIFETFHEGILHFNSTRIVKRNPTDPFDVTKAEIEAREQVFELCHFLKDNIEGFERARVLSTAIQIGIRESRKIDGEYTLTAADLKALSRFPDAIAVANYDMDIHNPEGSGTSHYFFGDGQWYEIPYRCLIPKHMDNLLVAGRCISSTHEAQASYRVMPYCAELGQAAGTAVAVAVRNHTDVRNVDVKQVQESLRKEGFVI